MTLTPKPLPPPNRVMFDGSIDGAICCALSGYISGTCKICGSDLVKRWWFGKEKCLRDKCEFNGAKNDQNNR